MGRTILVMAIAVAFVFVVSAFSYQVGFSRADIVSEGRQTTRSKAIISQAKQSRFSAVVLGDSHVELGDFKRICGMRTLNAGISGARAVDLVPIARDLFDFVKPNLVLISAGTNDSWVVDPTEDMAYFTAMTTLISLARKSGAQVMVLDVLPSAAPIYEEEKIFDQAVKDKRRSQIRELGVPVIEVASSVTDDAGYLSERFTDDGVHLNRAGYRKLAHSLEKVCRF